MKLSTTRYLLLFASLVAPTLVSAAGSLRGVEQRRLFHLMFLRNTCPGPDDTAACQRNLLPVRCGANDCEYDNQCIAEASGWNDSDCSQVNQDCPVPDGVSPCPMNLMPVVCGDQACQYDNECIAEASGWKKDNCTPAATECPISDPTQFCVDVYDPVSCGDSDCRYNNACLAENAGYGEGDCVPVFPETNRQVTDGQQEVCPETIANTPCDRSYKPVTCGSLDCEYDNICLAKAANWNESDCAAKQMKKDSTSSCPLPDKLTPCTMNYAPVKCGDLECQYDNLCMAEAANFNKMDCRALNCPPFEGGDASVVPCPLIYAPVWCEGGCVYDNDCLAVKAAGFEPEQCIGFTPPTPVTTEQQEVCPETIANTPCDRSYIPVTCGSLDCEYNNLCLAKAANWDEVDCMEKQMMDSTASCPTPAEGTFCTFNYAPVKCGNLECEYDNLCLAEAADFNKMDCRALNCPPFEGDEVSAVPCPAIYAPLWCEGGCVYDNECLATKIGGFQVEQCSELIPSSPVTKEQENECPVSTADTQCNRSYIPVTCGPLDCEYDNLCLAKAANWPEADCVETQMTGSTSTCPTPAEGTFCTFNYAPVKCGDLECEYDNLCLAEAANFDRKDCLAISCPPFVPEDEDIPAVACTEEYAPVWCEGACVYSNECLATKGAGYKSEQCIPL